MAKFADKDVDQLFRAILTLESIEECYRFFEDLCTINEIQSLAQRLEVARMLKVGYTYTHIEEKTGASTATISRVKRCLNYGADGYQTVLARLLPEDGTEAEPLKTDDASPAD
ncbi:MAG: YerC/YecD family TrpR-related protein [Bacillota bacterium]